MADPATRGHAYAGSQALNDAAAAIAAPDFLPLPPAPTIPADAPAPAVSWSAEAPHRSGGKVLAIFALAAALFYAWRILSPVLA